VRSRGAQASVSCTALIAMLRERRTANRSTDTGDANDAKAEADEVLTAAEARNVGQ